MMKTLLELHPGRLFQFDYDANTIYKMVRNEVDAKNAISDTIVQRVASKMDGEWIAFIEAREEHSNSYASVQMLNTIITEQQELIVSQFLGDFENVVFDYQVQAERAAQALSNVLGIMTTPKQLTAADINPEFDFDRYVGKWVLVKTEPSCPKEERQTA